MEVELQETSSKLNVQGLSRRNKLLMRCIEADPGETVISVDQSQGEPTVTGQYSKDKRFIYASYSGIGKPPFYDDDILMIDDIYLMGASVSPMGKEILLEAFNTTYRGNTFSEQWVEDKEVVKAELKETRAFHKTIILAKNYGQSAKGTVEYARDEGYVISLNDSKLFHDKYWNYLFKDVGKFKDNLERYVKTHGFLINPFGFRMTPKKPRDAFNYFCQSSVSGIMHILNAKFFAIDKVSKFISVIHDETLLSCPDEHLETAKKNMEIAVDSLNKDLNWIVPIRTGWVAGKNWYEAK